MGELTKAQRLAGTIYELRQAAIESPEAGADYLIRHKVRADATPEDKLQQFVDACVEIAHTQSGTSWQIGVSFGTIVRNVNEPVIKKALEFGHQKLSKDIAPSVN